MNAEQLRDLFRSEMSDTEEPYLWSDDEVDSFIEDAQRMFCRFTDGVADATTACVTQLNVKPGTTWLDTHPSLLKIRALRRADTGRPVEVLNEEDMPERNMRFDGRQGTVQALVVGMEADRARVWPDSSETVTLQATVFRLPLKPAADGFEIAPVHHRHLLLWTKHLAYEKHDAETYDKRKSQEFEQAFRAYCEQAKDEERRKRHKPRSVVYGGI